MTSPRHSFFSFADKQCGRAGHIASCVAFIALVGVTPPAAAVDGCVVLLCLAAPSWRNIPACVPTVRQLFRDLARGKPFPICSMSGSGGSASHAWSIAPDFCPPQYTRTHDGPNGPLFTCDFDGAISVSVEGTPFSRTWWSVGGDSVTEFSSAAKARLGNWDSRFEDDLAAWRAAQPARADSRN